MTAASEGSGPISLHDIARRAQQALRAVEDCGVDLILCGHLHQSHIERIRFGDNGSEVVVASAGTATSSRGRGDDAGINGFNLVEIEGSEARIEEIEAFISKFRYNASRASQVQSRIKKLEKMERIPPPPDDEPEIHFRFPDPPRSGAVVLELSRFSKSYESETGTERVFRNAGPLTIERGDKIAMVGPNGAGKSTLARILRGVEPFDGDRELGHKVNMSFYAQHQADMLDADQTVFEAVREVAPDRPKTELRSLLGTFLFTDDDAFKSVGVLSGGEKSRVALARTLLSTANFLILDEPTNHLDIQSKEVLIEALQQYEGTFVLVSHDRHVLDAVAEKVWRIGGGTVRTFLGNYSDFRWQVEHGSARALEGTTPAADPEDVEPELQGEELAAAVQTELARRSFAGSGYAYGQVIVIDGRSYELLWWHPETDTFGVRQADGHQLNRLLERSEIARRKLD